MSFADVVSDQRVCVCVAGARWVVEVKMMSGGGDDAGRRVN